jgi:hypothetical protein
MLYFLIRLCGTTKDELVIHIIQLHIQHQQLYMYHHVTKATEGATTYHQVHDIINEEASDRKGSFMKRE